MLEPLQDPCKLSDIKEISRRVFLSLSSVPAVGKDKDWQSRAFVGTSHLLISLDRVYTQTHAYASFYIHPQADKRDSFACPRSMTQFTDEVEVVLFRELSADLPFIIGRDAVMDMWGAVAERSLLVPTFSMRTVKEQIAQLALTSLPSDIGNSTAS